MGFQRAVLFPYLVINFQTNLDITLLGQNYQNEIGFLQQSLNLNSLNLAT